MEAKHLQKLLHRLKKALQIEVKRLAKAAAQAKKARTSTS